MWGSLGASLAVAVSSFASQIQSAISQVCSSPERERKPHMVDICLGETPSCHEPRNHPPSRRNGSKDGDTLFCIAPVMFPAVPSCLAIIALSSIPASRAAVGGAPTASNNMALKRFWSMVLLGCSEGSFSAKIAAAEELDLHAQAARNWCSSVPAALCLAATARELRESSLAGRPLHLVAL